MTLQEILSIRIHVLARVLISRIGTAEAMESVVALSELVWLARALEYPVDPIVDRVVPVEWDIILGTNAEETINRRIARAVDAFSTGLRNEPRVLRPTAASAAELTWAALAAGITVSNAALANRRIPPNYPEEPSGKF